MSQFKFIHAADLHIESPYKGVSRLNDALGKSLVEHGIQAYEKLIEKALDEAVDFLLIAGDSFDSDSGSLSAQYRFVRGLERLQKASISVYIICGNHDPLNSWSSHLELPDNVFRFDAEKVQHCSFKKNGKAIAEIYGVSFGEKEEFDNRAQEFKRNDNAPFAIGMLHGTIAGNEVHTPYCPFDLDTLRASKMDYWALGHIHKREVLHEQHPMVVYPGNIQGRHFNETGVKGCSVVKVDSGKITDHSFIPLSDIVYEYKALDVSGAESFADFMLKLEALKSNLDTDRSYLLRLKLTGKTNLHSSFSNLSEMQSLLDELNNENNYRQRFVFIDKCINDTLPEIDLEVRKASSDFIGDLIQRFESYEEDQSRLQQLKDELLDELSSSKVGRALSNADITEELDAEVEELIASAKWKAIDGLLKNQRES